MAQACLPKKFFARSALDVAPDLLGKYVIRRLRGRELMYRITETEAYHGHEDKASHASRGMTKRNEVMFGEPGRFYVYLIYGMYDMLNIVTGEDGHPSAVLIRGIEGFAGPGKLTKHLHITRALDGSVAEPHTGLWFEGGCDKVPTTMIRAMPRIGVAYAGEVWANKLYRFVLKK